MRILALAVIALFLGTSSSFGYGDEPHTSSIRIRLKGPTLRVRCRGGDCAVIIAHSGTSVTVSITRTQNGEPFNFTRTVENPTNVAIETGSGTDTVTVGDVSVPGFLRVALGSGDDQLDLNGTSAAKKTTINTGSGNDVVHLAPGFIGGKFSFAGQEGSDSVSVSSGLFGSKAGFDGGPGTDRLVMSAQPFAEPPAIRNFEQ